MPPQGRIDTQVLLAEDVDPVQDLRSKDAGVQLLLAQREAVAHPDRGTDGEHEG